MINSGNWLGDETEPLRGFDWKAGTNRITTGLLFWSDVFLYEDSRGEKYAIYLMDTQGLFDHKSSSTDNSRIFSLSTMISSTQILNLFNILQEDQLQYLQFATEYARYASSENEQSPFQNLMILIRDWNSPEEYKYGIRGGNAYLNRFLEIHDYQTRELQTVRRYLRSSFDKIDCFLMPHPGKKVARDSKYDGSWGVIDEEFVQGMHDLFPILLQPKKLIVKKINGISLKPADLLIFINNYVENFKNDSMPEASNIYESTLENQFRILTGKSYDIYVGAIASHNIELQSEDDIDKLHAESKAKALAFFNSEKKFGSYSEGLTFKNDLLKRIEDGFDQWKKVSMNFLKILKEQKLKTEQQNIQVQEAQNQDDKAKSELDQAIKNSEEARKALERARYDTEEARKEARELAEKAAQAEIDRAEAIEKENETREWLEKMTKDKDFFESQYNEYKQSAGQQVGQTLTSTQQDSGFVSVLKSVTTVLAAAVPFIGAISGLFG